MTSKDGEQQYLLYNVAITAPDYPEKEETGFYVPRRYIISFLLFLATALCYLLRANLSVAILPMANEFGWNEDVRGNILSSFFWGYICLQLPGSWLATRFGGKLVIGLGMLFSSLFTCVTPFVAESMPLLLISRFVTGFAEAVTYPTLAVLVSQWAPAHEKAQIMGFIWGGAYLGTVAAMLSGPPLIEAVGWRYSFVVNGVMGGLWTILWLAIAASSPEEMRGIRRQEVQYIRSTQGIPYSESRRTEVTFGAIKILFSSIHFWAIVIANFSRGTISC